MVWQFTKNLAIVMFAFFVVVLGTTLLMSFGGWLTDKLSYYTNDNEEIALAITALLIIAVGVAVFLTYVGR